MLRDLYYSLQGSAKRPVYEDSDITENSTRSALRKRPMNRMLHVLLGIVTIGGGATLFSMFIGEFNKHFQIQENLVQAGGFITEVEIVGGKSELHYRFMDITGLKSYTGLSVFERAQYSRIPVGMHAPVEYMDGNPKFNRLQVAHNEIFTLARNVIVGALLVVIGLAVIARGFGPSVATAASEFVEVES